MGLCTAFVFSALVEFTIVNFWFRKQRYHTEQGNVKAPFHVPSKTASKSTTYSNRTTSNNRNLLEKAPCQNYGAENVKQLSGGAKDTNGKRTINNNNLNREIFKITNTS